MSQTEFLTRNEKLEYAKKLHEVVGELVANLAVPRIPDVDGENKFMALVHQHTLLNYKVKTLVDKLNA